MIPDLGTREGRAQVKEACEKVMRLAHQRGSSVTCTQHPQDVIEDAKIMLAALEAIEEYVEKLAVADEMFNRQGEDNESLEKENTALRKEVNSLRAQLGMGRKYVEWSDTPKGGCPHSGG